MNLPGGTVTFLFTDIEGSTRLWEEDPEVMRLALARHDVLLRQAIEENQGTVFKTVGDAFCAAFHTAPDALAAALSAHLLLDEEAWEGTGPLRVRMGLHTGTAEERDGDYFGQTLNRVARLQGVGHGQQTLLSQTTYALVCNSLPADVTLADMGRHRFKDLLAPEHVWQLLHPALPAEFPPLKSLDYLPTNLPRQMTSFIGREQEMEQVKRLLSSTPLLTLLGSGGAGKTRLALQVGADVLDSYKNGVWLTELAALADPALIPQAVAGVLGLREEPGRPLLNTLQDYLRDRRLLLILDNCEHLLNACAHLAGSLLTSCPGLTILATSREPLGIAGEHPWRVPSLLTPGPKDLPMEEKEIAAVLMEYDACRLFVERAVVQRQDFVLTRSNVPVVARLCRQLDGIPLAIELAAARVRSLSVEEIDNKLDNRFRLLTGGSRTALPRQQTLRALIDWSYDLLNVQEKTLLRRLSVFAGGWTLKAVEQVGAGESGNGESIEDWEVLDLLSSLVDKSLVLAVETDGSIRYRMLETVRAYAAEKLQEAGEEQAVRGRHTDWYMVLSEEADPKLAGPEQGEWLNVLDTEHDNLRSVLQESLSRPQDNERSLRLCGALQRFWWTRGYLAEGREWCEAALARNQAIDGTAARAKVLNGVGALAWYQGDYAAARPYHEQSLEIRREIGDRQGIADSLGNLGNVAWDQGDYAAARAFYEQSLEIMREIGSRHGIAHSLMNLGNVAREQSDYAAARAFYEQSLEIMREIGSRQGIANSLMNLGRVARDQGDYIAARSFYEQSLEIMRDIGDQQGIAYSLMNLGVVAYDQGDDMAARAFYEQSLESMREIGDRQGIAHSLMNLGGVAYDQGDYAAARAYYDQSLEIYRDIGSRQGVTYSLEAFASLASSSSSTDPLSAEAATAPENAGFDLQRAPRLWGAAQALREQIGAPLPQKEQEEQTERIAKARVKLSETEWTTAWEQGRQMSLEQCIDYALERADALPTG